MCSSVCCSLKLLNLPRVEGRVSIISESNSGKAELTYRVASPLVLVFAANTPVALTVHVAAYVQSSSNGVYEMLIGQQVMNLVQGNIETSNQLFTYSPRPLDPETAHFHCRLYLQPWTHLHILPFQTCPFRTAWTTAKRPGRPRPWP